MNDSSQNTKCVLPWIHIAMKPSGEIRPCCISEFSQLFNENQEPFDPGVNFFTHSVDDIMSATQRTNIRNQMEIGQKPLECAVCYKAEERGSSSKRLQENKKWGDFTFRESLPVKYLDLRFTSQCNLKCVTCSPSESSSWRTDSEKILLRTQNPELKNRFSQYDIPNGNPTINEFFWSQLDRQLQTIEEIYFAGGEPLIQSEHYDCLQLILKRNLQHKIKIVYNTNGTKINSELMNIWSQFKSVQVNLSIDAIGEKNDYIRFPSKWHQIENALQLLDNSGSNIQVRLTVTVFALNVSCLKEIVTWKIGKNFKKIQTDIGRGDFDVNLLHFPKHLNIQIFDSKIKLRIENNLNEILSMEGISDTFRNKIRGTINYMHENQISESDGIFAFNEFLNIIGQIRSNNVLNVFPDIKEIVSAI